MLPEGSRLRGCKPGLWVSMDKKHPATEELPNVDLYNPVIEVINAQSSRNLQKKIIPWETSLDFKTPDLPIRDLVGAERRQTYIDDRNEASLVLVASLIDKAPNLGGLCRTCEVFAVDTLVLGNTRIIEERMFQSLSVTAEKWLHILEVMHTTVVCTVPIVFCILIMSISEPCSLDTHTHTHEHTQWLIF
jgi:tRNA G18 (ribose-2'-O)-methylase SpoU